MSTQSVDAYLADGCGRCQHYRTPACKVHSWSAPLVALRALLRATELAESVKWGSPCYTLGGKNVVMIMAFRDACALSFFKGAALDDPSGALESPGPSSRFVRLLRFRSYAELAAKRAVAQRLVAQAIELERAGAKVDAKPAAEPIPDELAQRLRTDARLRRAFEALTPGRRRSHILHISGAKQHQTRLRRLERCVVDILAGRGFHER